MENKFCSIPQKIYNETLIKNKIDKDKIKWDNMFIDLRYELEQIFEKAAYYVYYKNKKYEEVEEMNEIEKKIKSLKKYIKKDDFINIYCKIYKYIAINENIKEDEIKKDNKKVNSIKFLF
jgi:hypothetical protein